MTTDEESPGPDGAPAATERPAPDRPEPDALNSYDGGPLAWAPPGGFDPSKHKPAVRAAPAEAGRMRGDRSRSFVVGVVLTGGASRRMGTNKALVTLDGVPLARLVADGLEAGGAQRLLLVGNGPEVADALWLPSADDRWSRIGPLGGIATALLDVRAALGHGPAGVPDWVHDDDLYLVIAGCDQPDLSAGLVARLIAGVRTAPKSVICSAPVTSDGHRHPLPAAWRASAGPKLLDLVESGSQRASDAFGVGEVTDVSASISEFRDFDSLHELKERQARGALPPPLLGPSAGEPLGSP